MPPCISKDREDLVAAAGNRWTQVSFHGHGAMHTVPTPSSSVLAHYRAPLPLNFLMSCCGGVSRDKWGNSPDLDRGPARPPMWVGSV